LWNHQALTNTKNLEGEVLGELEQVALTILTILGHIIQAEKMIKVGEPYCPRLNFTVWALFFIVILRLVFRMFLIKY